MNSQWLGQPEASVILSTRNRAGKLRRALAALERQTTTRSWELVLIDNASTDETASVIAAFHRRSRHPVRTAVERRPGVAHAKNRALALATGRTLLFLDDDCYAAPDFVESWLGVFDRGALDWAAGRIELYSAADAPLTIRTDRAPHALPGPVLLPRGYLQGANMACRREVATAVGGFDPKFGPGAPYLSGDDMEYFQRAANLGFRGGYEPGPAVAHHHGRGAAERAALHRVYDVSYGAVLVKAALTNPGAVARRLTGRDGLHRTGLPRRLYWDARRRGLRTVAPIWLSRWRYGLQGGLHFAVNACRGQHRGFW